MDKTHFVALFSENIRFAYPLCVLVDGNIIVMGLYFLINLNPVSC